MKATHKPNPSKAGLVLANALALAWAGCASVGKQEPTATEGGETSITLPHRYGTTITPASKDKGKDDERFKLYPGSGVTV